MTLNSAIRGRRYWRHWGCLFGRFLIGILALAVVVWVCVWVDLSEAPWVPALVLIPIGWLAVQVMLWRSQYLYFDNTRLVFRRGLLDWGHYINYNWGDWDFDQRNLWARLWNYGTLQVGQHTFEDYWPFRELAEAVRMSLRSAAAPAQPTVAPAQPAVSGQPFFVFIPIRDRVVVREKVIDRSPPEPQALPRWESEGYVYGDDLFEIDHPSYAGLLAACEALLLPVGYLDLNAWVSRDLRRRYYPHGMSWKVALFYRELLQRVRIIDDRDLLFPRIRSIEDVRQRVPYFEVPRRLIQQN